MTISLVAIPDRENNQFVTLRSLLRSSSNINESLRVASVATLATAIDLNGIYTWDEFGRFKLVNKDAPECKFAFNLLARVYKFETDYEQHEQHPLEDTEDYPDDPYSSFGWATKVLPDFGSIFATQSEIIKPALISRKKYENNLNIVAALLAYIKGETKGIQEHSSFSSEADLIEVIEAEYKDHAHGLSKRTLEDKFAEAKQFFK